MPGGDGKITKEVDNEEHKAFLKKMKKALSERVEDVSVSQRLIDSPACVVAAPDDVNPQIRRMLEASGQEIPDTKPVLEINAEHPLVQRLSAEADSKRFAALSEIVLDHALLADGSQLENPADYVQRMNKLLLELDSSAGTS
jgi:molecular chaperone HtpG